MASAPAWEHEPRPRIDVGLGQPLRQLQDDLGLNQDDLTTALGIDAKTLIRWTHGADYPQSEARHRLQALVELHHALSLMWTNIEAARDWLHRPNPFLGHTEPVNYIRDGRIDRVEAALEAINSGFAS